MWAEDSWQRLFQTFEALSIPSTAGNALRSVKSRPRDHIVKTTIASECPQETDRGAEQKCATGGDHELSRCRDLHIDIGRGIVERSSPGGSVTTLSHEQIIAVISKLRGSRIVHPIAVQFAKLTSEGSLISQEQKPSLLVGLFVIQGTKRDSSSKHLKQLSELALSFVRALIPWIHLPDMCEVRASQSLDIGRMSSNGLNLSIANHPDIRNSTVREVVYPHVITRDACGRCGVQDRRCPILPASDNERPELISSDRTS